MSQWIQAVLNAGTFKAWAKQLWKDAPMRARQVLLLVAILLLFSFCSGSVLGAEASVTSTRVGAFDYQAQRSDGTNTNHQRPELAAFACANWLFLNPGKTCAVQGGKWQITVTLPDSAPVTGSATLNWTVPATYSDGRPLTESLCYRIEYGTSDFAQTASTCSTSHQITGLTAGTWQFRIRAVTAAGEASSPSNVRGKTL